MASLSTKEKWLEEFDSKEAPKPSSSWLMGKPSSARSVRRLTKMWLTKSQIGQHVGSKTHEKNCQLKWKRNVTQAELEDCFATKQKKSRAAIVGKELCEAFLTASIPWMKLDVPKFRRFLQSNIRISMPDRTTLEKKYFCNKRFKTLVFLIYGPYLSEFQNHIFWHFQQYFTPQKMIKTYFAEQNDIKIPCLIMRHERLLTGEWGSIISNYCVRYSMGCKDNFQFLNGFSGGN